MSIVREFDLYLNVSVGSAPFIHVNQYDHDEVWKFSIYEENGTLFTPTTVSLIGKKADGTIITVAGSVVGGKAVITETEQMTAAAGKAVFELHVGNNHGTANFTVDVEPSPTEGGIESESDLSLIQEAIDKADEIHDYAVAITISGETIKIRMNS